ncbi:hypothetical protein AVEN_170397-1 [Araneus ventricosus]|uniref:DUF4817 domain-containing protein n=1 Tax=Araneus ventricosus TaxID=182803 RepID=A0A4Y2N611_ARAVE|nr:hypothetical protein AVEN_170397-1 [Araneus ventricosus]
MVHYGAQNLQQREIPNSSVKMATVQQKACMVHLWFHESKSTVPLQRCFLLENRNFQSPNKNIIKRWYEQFKGTENVHHRKGVGQPYVLHEVVEPVRGSFTT